MAYSLHSRKHESLDSMKMLFCTACTFIIAVSLLCVVYWLLDSS